MEYFVPEISYSITHSMTYVFFIKMQRFDFYQGKNSSSVLFNMQVHKGKEDFGLVKGTKSDSNRAV